MSAAVDFGNETRGQMDPSGYIPSFYVQSPHSGADLDAVVTEGGEPIRVNGEVLTVRKCPPAFRFAIGPVTGGEAELLKAEEFWKRFDAALIEYYREECKQPFNVADLQYEVHPTPRAFVAKKWNLDRSKVIPLGTELETAPAEQEPAMLYDPRSDRLISREELEEMKRAQASKEESLARENEELKSRLEAIEAKLTAAPEPKPKREQPIVVAPCGKECKGDFGKRAHMRGCDACKASETGPEAA